MGSPFVFFAIPCGVLVYPHRTLLELLRFRTMSGPGGGHPRDNAPALRLPSAPPLPEPRIAPSPQLLSRRERCLSRTAFGALFPQLSQAGTWRSRAQLFRPTVSPPSFQGCISHTYIHLCLLVLVCCAECCMVCCRSQLDSGVGKIPIQVASLHHSQIASYPPPRKWSSSLCICYPVLLGTCLLRFTH